MKKFAVGLLAISMVLLLVFALNGAFDDVEGHNDISGINEAAFSMPTSQSGASDATTFLVGEFDGADGSHLSFDGHGNMKLTAANGIVHSGKCTLLQQADRSAMIQFVFDEGSEVFSFTLVSEKGDFALTDADQNVILYSPVIV